MMTEPRLVLLDEPGAGVNPTLLLKLRDMIRHLNRQLGYTFVIIEHDMDLIASLCERVIVLAEGSVLTEGSMDVVRRDSRVIHAYLSGGEEGGPPPPGESGGTGQSRARDDSDAPGAANLRTEEKAKAGSPASGPADRRPRRSAE